MNSTINSNTPTPDVKHLISTPSTTAAGVQRLLQMAQMQLSADSKLLSDTVHKAAAQAADSKRQMDQLRASMPQTPDAQADATQQQAYAQSMQQWVQQVSLLQQSIDTAAGQAKAVQSHLQSSIKDDTGKIDQLQVQLRAAEQYDENQANRKNDKERDAAELAQRDQGPSQSSQAAQIDAVQQAHGKPVGARKDVFSVVSGTSWWHRGGPSGSLTLPTDEQDCDRAV